MLMPINRSGQRWFLTTQNLPVAGSVLGISSPNFGNLGVQSPFHFLKPQCSQSDAHQDVGIQTSEVFSTLTLPLLFLRGGASGLIWVCAGISQYVASSCWTALPCGASVYGCRPGAPLKSGPGQAIAKITRLSWKKLTN